MAEQTRRLADVLERHDIPTRLPSEVVTLGEVTGGMVQADAWRAIRFLPVVAQRDRKPMLNALKLWQRAAGGDWLRYAVITSGDRVPLGENLRARQSEHTRRISRWAHEALKDWGVEVVFRGTEYTVNDDGAHLHSNVLYRPVSKLSSERWAEFLAWTGGRVGAHWKDCGRIEDVAEVVKYAVKPAELEALDDEHVVWLYQQTFACKLCQPMGAFAEWLKGLSQDRLKVAQVVDAAGAPGERRKGRLKLVEKPRRDPAKPKKRQEDKGESAIPDAPETDAEDVPEAGGAEAEAESLARRAMGENVLVARTLPQPKFSPWAEPLSLVINYTESPTTPDGVRRLELLRERRAEARRWWDANGAPDPEAALAAAEAAGVGAFKVHTGSPTVQAEKQPPPPRRVVTVGDGLVVDGDTGEVLLEPPPRPLEPGVEWVSEVVETAAGAAARFADENPGKFRDLDRQLAADLRRYRMALAVQAHMEADRREVVAALGQSAWAAPCSTAGRARSPHLWSEDRDAPRPDAIHGPPRAAEGKGRSQGTRLHGAARSVAEEAGVERPLPRSEHGGTFSAWGEEGAGGGSSVDAEPVLVRCYDPDGLEPWGTEWWEYTIPPW